MMAPAGGKGERWHAWTVCMMRVCMRVTVCVCVLCCVVTCGCVWGMCTCARRAPSSAVCIAARCKAPPLRRPG
ncbi:MAG: hypothetical protein J3K34DRAFT_429446 [Monoraphidium minutum]|nr:MAG: hypothetical protein J3K34DRAFT_429446 [Monoraphidium minutum]